jgi:hypothetical protein
MNPRPQILLLMAAAALAASGEDMAKGYFHGTMVAWEGTAASGQLSARNAAGDIYTCGFDSKTYLEIELHKVSITKFQAGDPVEILVDRKPGSRLCYSRIVRVVPPQAARSPRKQVVEATVPRPRTVLTPRGNRTIAGLVIRNENGMVTLRTREGEENVRLRGDTRYLENGRPLSGDSLAVNMRVSMRVSSNLDGELEAYQVTWGDLLSVP